MAFSTSAATRFLEGLLPRNLLEGRLAARVVELFKSVETVSAVSHQLTGLGDIAQLLRQFQHADFGLDDVLFRST